MLIIYKDWANHYLEKYLNKSGGKTLEDGLINSKGFIKNLSRDLQDGILLVGIIESFTSSQIGFSKIHQLPISIEQMVHNIDACISHLQNLGLRVDGISSSDICAGNLKSILSLFYHLSHYKAPCEVANNHNQHNHSDSKEYQCCKAESNLCLKQNCDIAASNHHQVVINNMTIPSKLPQRKESKIRAPSQVNSTLLKEKILPINSKAINDKASETIPTSLATINSSAENLLHSNHNIEQKAIKPPRPSSLLSTGTKLSSLDTYYEKSGLVSSKTSLTAKGCQKFGTKQQRLVKKKNGLIKSSISKSNVNSFDLNSSKCDSSPSLSENEPNNKVTVTNKQVSALRPVTNKPKSLGIPSPKVRASSMYLENSDTVSLLPQSVMTNKSYKSTPRPLSSSTIAKPNIATIKEKEEKKQSSIKYECALDKIVNEDGDSAMAAKSESNVARVSPIRRQIGDEGKLEKVINSKSKMKSESGLKQFDHSDGRLVKEQVVEMEKIIFEGAIPQAKLQEASKALESKAKIRLLDNLSNNEDCIKRNNDQKIGHNKILVTPPLKLVTSLMAKDKKKERYCKKMEDNNEENDKQQTGIETASPSQILTEICKAELDDHVGTLTKAVSEQTESTLLEENVFSSNNQAISQSSLITSINQIKRLSKNGDFKGSTASLLLATSNTSVNEEKYNHEVKKLRNDLIRANEKVDSLTNQLKNNADIINAFDQTLLLMKSRLNQCSLTSEQKDREINRLKSTIEALRKECDFDDSFNDFCQQIDTKRKREKSRKKQKEFRSPSSGREENGSSWLKESISKAFKKTRTRNKSGGSVSDIEASYRSNDSFGTPGTPMLKRNYSPRDSYIPEESIDQLSELKRQLHDKEKLLTELQLEGLAVASQMENMKDKMNKMTIEISMLKSENERLQRFIQRQSMLSSIGSLTSCSESSLSNCNEKKVLLKLQAKTIGFFGVSLNTSWDHLDLVIKKLFTQYLARIDEPNSLDIKSSSLFSYLINHEHIDRKLGTDQNPGLPPFNYLSVDNNIVIKLRNKLDYLAIETNTPKSVLERLIYMLQENRRLILKGPACCGKHYLASKCAQYVLEELNEHCSIATITIKENEEEEIRSFVSSLIEQILSNQNKNLPNVIILKSVQAHSELWSVLDSLKVIHPKKCPYIICTMANTSFSSSNLEVEHQFRSIVYNNNMEPCKGLLNRYLKRKLIDVEIESSIRGVVIDVKHLEKVIDWLQQLYHRLNHLMEKYDLSYQIDYQFFFTCPLGVNESLDWFTNLWNRSLGLLVKENLNKLVLQNNKAVVNDDPLIWIKETYPWITAKDTCENLIKVIESNNLPKDQCFNKQNLLDDSLLNTLMRLQQASS